MSEKLPRRSFLSRLGLGLTTIIALPLQGVTNAIKEEDMPVEPIKKTRPLGFQWETADPFLFCVHHEDKFPRGNDVMGPATSVKDRPLGDDFIIKDGFRMYHGKTVPGFPGHPHRGFETITVVREGIVDHADSLGAAGRYGYGDVQWMTAGAGVQHSEMFPLIHKDKENPMELFQIWLNLPRRNKMVQPHFKMLWAESIPNFEHRDNAGLKTVVEVIAGTLGGKKAPAPPPDSWAADANNHVAVWNIKMEAKAIWTLPAAAAGINRTLYYYQGEGLNLAGKTIPRYHAIEVQPDMALSLRAGNQPTSILLLQGRPIGEPVIQYGPFVMNTKEEIQQAFDDYHRTKFGGWPWPKYDQVHPRDKGRFARHADGKEEVKG
jgi:redox-sensitive bicupin YhaK (pirin superfamily)